MEINIPQPLSGCNCGCCREAKMLAKKGLNCDYACTCLNYDDEFTCACLFCENSMKLQKEVEQIENEYGTTIGTSPKQIKSN